MAATESGPSDLPVPARSRPDQSRPRKVVWSSRVRFPKIHLDAECRGLEKVGDWRQSGFKTPLSLFNSLHSRPCRACALEEVVTAVAGAPSLHRGPARLVTFSGQANPSEVSADRFEYREVSESGVARLRRLAAVLDLDVVEGTPVGPVVVGILPSRLTAGLSRNLRTLSCAPVPVAGPEHVRLVWEMLVSHPPECGQAPYQDTADLWSLCRAILQPSC